jgi:heavy metal sensor kinase
VVGILIVLAGIRYVGYHKVLLDKKDYSLRVVADLLESSIRTSSNFPENIPKTFSQMVKTYPDIEFKGTIIEVYDASRSLVFLSSRSAEQKLSVTESMWRKSLHRKSSLDTLSVAYGGNPIRVLTKPVFSRSELLYVIQVGSSMQDIESSLGSIIVLNLLFIPIAIFLVATGGWWVTRRALAPLDVVVQTAHRISSGDLSHRIEVPKAGREIQVLMDSFNQMVTRLEASFRQIRDFTDNVSHELRIPLSILKGQTELSLRRSRSEKEYREVLESNLEEIHRLEKIVERLLFLSKADRGDIPLHWEDVDLRHLLTAVYEQFQLLAKNKKIRLSLRMDAPVCLGGDEILLRELATNLIQNAIVYTPEGGEVAIRLERNDSEVSLSVMDTGCGIPAEEIPHIFDRFYQVDKSRSSQGSGLGLSICKWIAEVHGAVLSVESSVGIGSRFSVVFPVRSIKTI